MDPLTQGVLGAALPQATSAPRYAASAGLLGLLAGMAADLDVLIQSSTDPLLFLEYHRQFTHSLVFIPVGGMICAVLLHGLIGRRRSLSFRQTWVFCTLGYATHALLDACEADLKTVCPEANDRWSRRQCLKENREKVSSACQDAMRDARRAHRGHHRDGAEGRP